METQTNFPAHRFFTGSFKFAIVLILVGLAFLAVNTGIIDTMYQPLFGSWPIWLVFGGILCLLNCGLFSGITLLTVGVFFIIPEIGAINPALNIPENFTRVYWPALLVIAGLYSILGIFIKPRYCGVFVCHPHHHHHHRDSEDWNTTSFDSEDGFVRVSSSFDSRKSIVMEPVFKGGEVDCSFGEVILDLRKTTLSEGKTRLSVNVSFGSVQVIVPADWNVQVRGNSAFGSFIDGRISPTYRTDSDRTLLIDGKCSFGECKLRD